MNTNFQFPTNILFHTLPVIKKKDEFLGIQNDFLTLKVLFQKLSNFL